MALPKVGHAGLTWQHRPGDGAGLLLLVKALLLEGGDGQGKRGRG